MPFFETRRGERIFYDDIGRGTPVVFVHGLTVNRHFFKHQVTSLKDRFRVIAYDQLGHGDSDAPAGDLNLAVLAENLGELLDTLEIETAALVGWSLGAHVIFEFIQRHGPWRISRVAVIDMAPKLMKTGEEDPLGPWRFGLRGVSGKYGDFDHADNTRIMAGMAQNWELYARVVSERIFNRSLYVDEKFNGSADFKGKAELDWIHAQLLRNRPCVIITLWASLAVADYRALLPEISVPVLLTYGEESNYYPPENYAYMAEKLPNAVVVPFTGCGHALHLQEPDRFNRELADFLSK